MLKSRPASVPDTLRSTQDATHNAVFIHRAHSIEMLQESLVPAYPEKRQSLKLLHTDSLSFKASFPLRCSIDYLSMPVSLGQWHSLKLLPKDTLRSLRLASIEILVLCKLPAACLSVCRIYRPAARYRSILSKQISFPLRCS